MDNFILQFKDKFIDEALTLLKKLEGDLLELENNPENKKHIEEVFRVMHTLKGVAGMYGFINIQNFTHQLETIYDLVRSGEIKITEHILDITLKSVDHIKKLLNQTELTEETNTEEHEKLNKEILEIVISTGIPINEKTNNPIKTNKQNIDDSQLSTYYIMLVVEESFVIRGIKLIDIFKELASLGKYQIIEHNFPESEKSENDTTWGIYIATEKTADDIEDVFLFVSDCIIIRKIAVGNLFSKEDFTEKLKQIKNTNNKEDNIVKQKSIIELVEKKYQNNEIKLLESIEKPKENKSLNIEEENIPEHIRVSSSRILVDAEKLDTLMFLVTELVTTQSRFDLALQNNSIENLHNVYLNIQKLTKQFRDNTLSMRLVPISDMMISFKRLIRDLSKKLGKEIEFTTQGMETELDKSTIDAISEPIMHIIRNCIDHGIELPEEREGNNKSRAGLIKLTAHHSGNFVFINIQDDGKGIDKERIVEKAINEKIIKKNAVLSEKEIYELLFLPGFTTAENVTEISGRGVGMDIVNKKIKDLRGEIEVNSELGLGTSFTIKLQQTIAILDTMLIQTGNMYFLLPLSEVEVCIQRTKNELYKSKNRRIEHEGTLISFVSLRDEFELKQNNSEKEQLIIINKHDKKFAITADKIIGEHQAVLKPLGEIFKNQKYLSGASILGDGEIAMMIDTGQLINLQ